MGQGQDVDPGESSIAHYERPPLYARILILNNLGNKTPAEGGTLTLMARLGEGWAEGFCDGCPSMKRT